MRSASLYRVGGLSLVAGAAALAVAVLLHAPQPDTLAAFSSLNMTSWMTSHWLMVVSPIGILAGGLALSRHFAGSAADGFAALGLSGLVLSLAGLALIGGIETAAFGAAAGMGPGQAGEQAFATVSLVMLGILNATAVLFWLSFLGYGLAMLRDAAFPQWLGLAGVALGIVELGAHFTIQAWVATQVLFVIGMAWLGLVGWNLVRLAGEAQTRTPADMVATA